MQVQSFYTALTVDSTELTASLDEVCGLWVALPLSQDIVMHTIAGGTVCH